MTEVSLKELDQRIQRQVDNASKAIDRGNPNYAIDICSNILKKHPGCLDVRKILRSAQMKAHHSKGKGLTKFLGSVTNAPFMMKASNQAKKDPEQAMESAEKLLSSDPTNIAAQQILGGAATALELHQTAVFAYENARDQAPGNLDVLVNLAEAYFQAGRYEDSIRTGDVILRKEPGNGKAQDLIKKASVQKTSFVAAADKGGEVNTRDLLKDADETAQLEEASRVINDKETLTRLINKAKERLESEPDNVKVYGDISMNYARMKDYDSAIEWIQKARKLPKGMADSTLETREIDLQTEKLKSGVADLKAQLDETPDNAELKGQLEEAQKAYKAFEIKQASEMVEKYPNNYEYRFKYGQLLFESGDHQNSAKEFQLATRNPKLRGRALVYLGRAFKLGKKFDLAADQLRTAKDEMLIMDSHKKEVIYELADCYEIMEKKDEAFIEWKELYSADLGYRDVADRINKYYD